MPGARSALLIADRRNDSQTRGSKTAFHSSSCSDYLVRHCTVHQGVGLLKRCSWPPNSPLGKVSEGAPPPSSRPIPRRSFGVTALHCRRYVALSQRLFSRPLRSYVVRRRCPVPGPQCSLFRPTCPSFVMCTTHVRSESDTQQGVFVCVRLIRVAYSGRQTDVGTRRSPWRC